MSQRDAFLQVSGESFFVWLSDEYSGNSECSHMTFGYREKLFGPILQNKRQYPPRKTIPKKSFFEAEEKKET